MAKTATERSRVLRERRAHGKVVLTVVGEDELAEIARADTPMRPRLVAGNGKRPSACSLAMRSGGSCNDV
jgi:hypothetical protein